MILSFCTTCLKDNGLALLRPSSPPLCKEFLATTPFGRCSEFCKGNLGLGLSSFEKMGKFPCLWGIKPLEAEALMSPGEVETINVTPARKRVKDGLRVAPGCQAHQLATFDKLDPWIISFGFGM